MVTALVPVDGSQRALAAARHVIRLVQVQISFGIHLLSVQPLLSGYARAFVTRRAANNFRQDEAQKAFQPACELLNRAGIPYTKHIYISDAATVIAECAYELHCNMVVMRTHGFGTVDQLLFGSVSHRAVHKMDARIPITLVKAEHQVQNR